MPSDTHPDAEEVQIDIHYGEELGANYREYLRARGNS
jgi:hypothetical protein